MSTLAPQSQRDAEAAAIGCTWLAPCVNSKTKSPIRHDKCGHEWLAMPNTVKKGSGCPKCGLLRRRTAPITQERRDEEAAAVDCTWLGDPTIHNKQRTLIRCNKCGHRWETVPDYIRKNAKRGMNSGCINCSDNMPVPQKVRDAEAALVHAIWLEPCGKSTEKKKLLCTKCEKEYFQTPHSIKRRHGCPDCTTCYIDFEGPTKVYLIVDDIAQKVGITSSSSRRDRLATLQKSGWKEVIKVWEVPLREIALAIEAETVDYWRFEIEAPQAYRNGERNGASESVKLKFVTVEQTIEKIEELVRKVYEEQVEENGQIRIAL